MDGGGVACMPLHRIMERFSVGDTPCSINNGGGNCILSSKSLKFANKIMAMNNIAGSEKGEVEVDGRRGKAGDAVVENNEVVEDKVRKEEVEEGEFGTLKFSKDELKNVEILVQNGRPGQDGKTELLSEKCKKNEVENAEFDAGECKQLEVENGEMAAENAIIHEYEKLNNGLGRCSLHEAKKDEFVADRWLEAEKDDYFFEETGSYDAGTKEKKEWKCEVKDFSRSGSAKRSSSRIDTLQEKNQRLSSKYGDCESSFINGKNYERENLLENRLKRHVADTEGSDRKHHCDFGDYKSPKSRRISDDSIRSVHSVHHSRSSVERSYRNSSSTRNPYSRRSSKSVIERHCRSPVHSERSVDRARYHGFRDRSPSYRGRSPYDRSRLHDRRNRSPDYVGRSPHDHARHHDHTRETSKKSEAGDKPNNHINERDEEDKLNGRYSARRIARDSQDRVRDINATVDNIANCKSHNNVSLPSPILDCKVSIKTSGVSEEPTSMEEDMDICNTPPHVSVMADSTARKWFYLDHLGVEQGPFKLCDLKRLVEDGVIVSDHFIKHADSYKWLTVENAVSPLATVSFPATVSDSETQLVNFPKPSCNLLIEDSGEFGQSSDKEKPNSASLLLFGSDKNSAASKPLEDLYIDERVKALLHGFNILQGKELEAIGEALQISFDRVIGGRGDFEDSFWHLSSTEGQLNQRTNCPSNVSETTIEATEFSSDGYTGNAFSSACGEFADWFSSLWSCKGGDWKRNDEIIQDKCFKKKLVLNDGYPLCQMPKSGYEDPRRHRKDELYQPSHRKLDLPSWAFSFLEEDIVIGNSVQTNPVAVKGTKGLVQPVIRINACVLKDRGSFVYEPRVKVRVKERSGLLNLSTDLKRPSVDNLALSADRTEHLMGDTRWPALINIQKDYIYRVDDLQLHLGDWYYLDGAGHEHGPFQFSELQVMVDRGLIMKNSSVFRKFDNIWVPINSATTSNPLDPYLGLGVESDGNNMVSDMYHNLHPQFIGYTRGKLHELVMKSYKSREFAAAVNEVLDPWISAKQLKKEMEKYVLNSSFYKGSESEVLPANGAQNLVDGSEDDCEMKRVSVFLNNDFTFDDLCGDDTFHNEKCDEMMEMGKWGLLNGHLLARIFHFLRSDIKSMLFASLTCKHWRAASTFYKDISRHVDLSSIGLNCTDSMVRNILNGYKKTNVTSMALIGCNNITSSTVEEIIASFPHLTSMDIRGCFHFDDLAFKFPNLSWIMNGSGGLIDIEEPHCKIRSLKQLAEKTSMVGKSYKGLDSQTDDFSALKDYFDSVDKRDAANKPFRGSLYKRSKLYDARKSSSILSTDVRIRRWALKKSDNGYKKIEDFLSFGLKCIMKENTYDFFISKVAEIERRMRSGYYVSHGLKSVKKDIAAMCRDAIKAKHPGDAGFINHIIKLFIQLATHLEDNSKSCHERDEMTKMWKNDFPAALTSPTLKYKKNLHRRSNDRKYNNKGSCTSINGGSDPREFVSDKEVRRCLSKLNKKFRDSESEISDGLNYSSEDSRSDSEKNTSDTNSELNSRSECGSGDFRRDDSLTGDRDPDSFMSVDREWGARMTKASLVPPITRKYEVIDHYVIVADEEDVLRKMKVSLPENYAEKVSAQEHRNQESDMGIPELKDFKPRKELGNEVIEQEVYGIDPYTHNLLLDSMPDDLDWPLVEKHLFIENVLLRTLNKQVRDFTGTGNTPKMYFLRPVVEEILKIADKDRDMRIIKICQSILKSMNNRPDDNYVAYRKGLGVVCNKDSGFSEDEFVVEFLGEVYPAWKWFEKQDGIRSLQKYEDTASEFYNINLERPKGDADGYDLVVVDAMHKANFASRICHSCRPNCQAKVTAVGGQYQIGIYSMRSIHYGEEITFDYNSVTESKEEYEVSVCLCGSQVCRGSYLNLTGEGGFQKVLKESHGVLNRLQLMVEACEIDSVSEEDYIDFGEAGLGNCLLGGLPDWVVAYSARLVRYINFERLKLPEGILRNNLDEKHKYFANLNLEDENTEAQVQAEGVYLQRLQNLALTLDKVRYVMRRVFGDAKKAPPPLERLSPEAMVLLLWEGEGSLVEQLLQCMAPHIEVNELKAKVHARHPLHSHDIQTELQRSLLWLRDELRNLPCTSKCRNDAAADLIHIYAYTKSFFRVLEYKTVTSPAIKITALDLGSKYGDTLGEDGAEYCKTYGPSYCVGQLMYWYSQTNVDPDRTLVSDGRGCLYLPDIASFYDEAEKPVSRHRVYGQRTVRSMLAKMEKQAQRAWPEDLIWCFRSAPAVIGSPMLDAVLTNCPLDKGMVHWLKSRPAIFEGAPAWDS